MLRLIFLLLLCTVGFITEVQNASSEDTPITSTQSGDGSTATTPQTAQTTDNTTPQSPITTLPTTEITDNKTPVVDETTPTTATSQTTDNTTPVPNDTTRPTTATSQTTDNTTPQSPITTLPTTPQSPITTLPTTQITDNTTPQSPITTLPTTQITDNTTHVSDESTRPTTAASQTTDNTTSDTADTTTRSADTTTGFELHTGPECGLDDKTCFGNATCDENLNICKCIPEFVLSGDWTRCLPVTAAPYESQCEEDSQCLIRMGDGANCTNGICVCGDGYHYLHSVCYKTRGFGESCTEDDECFGTYNSESLSCNGNQCNCSEGFYLVGTNECRRSAKKTGDECVFNDDCQFPGGQCSASFTCSSQQTRNDDEPATSTTTTENPEEKTTEEYVSTNTYNSEGETTIVSESMDTTSHDGGTTSYSTKTLGDSCSSTEECISSLDNSRCFARICECQPKFSNFSGSCKPDFGEACDSDEDLTYVTNGVCRNKILRCKAPYIVGENNKECRYGRKYGKQCQQNEDCQYSGSKALCVNRHCTCFQGYHYVEDWGICVLTQGIGQSCSQNNDCYVTSGNVICNETCQCIAGSHTTEEKTCIPDVQALGDMCVTTKDCSDAIQHSICFNKTCQCDTSYYQATDNKTCLTGVGASCVTDDDCTTAPMSTCFNETCTCEEGTISNAESTSCLKVASDIRSECQEAVQCITAFGNCSDCIDGVCQCNDTCHYQHNYCYEIKLLGEACFVKSECYLKSEETDRVQCRNGICKCDYQYTQTEDLDCTSDAYKNAISSVVIGTCVLIYIILCETKYTL